MVQKHHNLKTDNVADLKKKKKQKQRRKKKPTIKRKEGGKKRKKKVTLSHKTQKICSETLEDTRESLFHTRPLYQE